MHYSVEWSRACLWVSCQKIIGDRIGISGCGWYEWVWLGSQQEAESVVVGGSLL